MSDLHFFWVMQPEVVRYFVRGLLVLFVVILVGIIKSAYPLFTYRARLPDHETLAEFDTDLLAKAALANRLPRLEDSRAPNGSTTNSADLQKLAANLQITEKRFLSQWETALANVCFARGACSLILLISLVMIGCSATAVFEQHRGQYTIGWPWHELLTFIELSELLALGVSLCLPIYLLTSVIEWRLRIRKARWQHFCATIMEDRGRDGRVADHPPT